MSGDAGALTQINLPTAALTIRSRRYGDGFWNLACGTPV